MSTVAPERLYTPEDLSSLPDGEDFELVDGRLVRREMGTLSSWVAGRIIRLLGAWGEDTGLCWVLLPDTAYQCFPDHPAKVRKPDASFILRGRLPGEELPTGNMFIRPDLAVEVLSPNDLADKVNEKLGEYLDAGIPLIWIVDPRNRKIQTFENGQPRAHLTERDELTGGAVLPGFRCAVRDIFRLGPPIVSGGGLQRSGAPR